MLRISILKLTKFRDTGRVTVVADMGIITGDNIYYLTGGKNQNGYVFSLRIRGGTDALKSYVTDDAGYVDSAGKPVVGAATFKLRNRVIAPDINVTMRDGSIKNG